MGARRAGVELTFDDGPDATWTPIVLRELARLGVRATFFVISPAARALPHLVRAVVAAGHRVELHCAAHVRHSLSEREEIEADTDRALADLAHVGVRPWRWRTPWGDTAPWTEEVARDRGLTLVGWTADSHDWRGDPAETMLSAIRDDLGPGGIVLMHDGLGPGASRADCLQTVRLIAPLCDAIRAGGLDVAPPEPAPELAR